MSLWNGDPPPCPGWYNAAHRLNIHNAWRWWDGVQWSQPAWPHYTAEQAAEIAQMKAAKNERICWRKVLPAAPWR
jgi:hypothetical protein